MLGRERDMKNRVKSTGTWEWPMRDRINIEMPQMWHAVVQILLMKLGGAVEFDDLDVIAQTTQAREREALWFMTQWPVEGNNKYRLELNDPKSAEPIEKLMREKLLQEIVHERQHQDAMHGGPAHDDTYERHDWIQLICDYASSPRMRTVKAAETPEQFEKHMIQVAALAVAAIQSSRRKRG